MGGVTNFFHLDGWKKLGSQILSFNLDGWGPKFFHLDGWKELGSQILSFHLDGWEGPHLFPYLTLWNVWLLGLWGWSQHVVTLRFALKTN